MARGLLAALLLAAAGPALAYRRAATSAGEARSPYAGVQQFVEWSAENCEDCGATLGALFRGLRDANFLEASEWQADTLTVTLTEDHVYGEIADKSRLPLTWALGKSITLKFAAADGGETRVQASGLGVEASPQGLELYEAAMRHGKLDGSACVDDAGCIQAEIKAAGKYLGKEWKRIKKEGGKISRLLRTSYGSTALYWAAKASGTDWGEVFYAMIVACSSRITGFVFGGGRVYVTTEGASGPEYARYHLAEKSSALSKRMLVTTTAGEKELMNKFARSSLNFGLMMSYLEFRGLYDEQGVAGGRADAITNLFAWCAGTAASELPACSGSTPGRVGWAPSPRK